VTRGRAVALLVLGCALAAAAAGTGPYLLDDRDVPPFRVIARRALRERKPERLKPAHGALHQIGSILQLAVQVVLVLVVLAVVALGTWQLIRALMHLTRLRLARSVGRVTTDAYDDEARADDSEAVLRRRLTDELAALSADLDETGDAREAVIACYVRMERALAEAGSPRRPSESPLELLSRVLGEQDVPEPDVRRLTDLFTEARFSDHPVTGEMRDAARRSLRGIADALAVTA
jgi:hypothetical protein